MRLTFLLSFLLILPTTLMADSLKDMLVRVEKFAESGNYSKALDELKWVNNELQKGHFEKLKSFFPESISDFSGEKFNSNAVMGMVNISRDYKFKGNKIKASLTGNSSSGGGNPFGQIAQMAQMYGGAGSSGNEVLRVQGRTARIEQNGNSNRGSITVFLDGGLMLKLEGRGIEKDKYEEYVNKFDLSSIEKYMKN